MATKTKKDKEPKVPKVPEASDTQTIHVPLLRTIVTRVDRLAEADRRTRVNMIEILVEQALDAKEEI